MSTPTPPPALINAIRGLLKPLIRLLLEYGMTYPWFANQLKSLFVEVVNDEMQVDGKRQTLSRISVVSGVHRKDVKRILEEPEDAEAPSRTVSLGARLLGVWLGDRRYHDVAGNPLPLPRLSTDNTEVSFEGLVESINKDVRPRAVLDEWQRAGLVHINPQDEVVLDPDAFVTEKNFDDRAHFFGRNIRDHIAAGAHNLMPGIDEKMLERAVFYDHLCPRSVETLKQLSHQVAMDGLKQVNEAALRLAEQDENKPGAHYRMTFGSFFFQQDQQTESDPDVAHDKN